MSTGMALVSRAVSVFAALAVVVGVDGGATVAQLSISGVYWRDATVSPNVWQNDQDASGTMFIMVRNTGSTAQTITPTGARLTGTGANAATLDSLVSGTRATWWASWPMLNQTLSGTAPARTHAPLMPGEERAIRVKGSGMTGPLNAGKTVTVQVDAVSGATATRTVSLVDEPLRIADVVPSRDLRSHYIYLRNLDAGGTYTTNSLFLGGVDVTARSTWISGSSIGPNRTGIVRIDYDAPQAIMKETTVRLDATRITGSGTALSSTAVSTGVPIRIQDPVFTLGCYGANVNQVGGPVYQCLQTMKQLGLDVTVGPIDQDNSLSRYNLKRAGSPGSAQTVIDELDGNPGFLRTAFFISDEPASSATTARSVLDSTNQVRYLNDQNPAVDKPTWVNLNGERWMNQYGWMQDIIANDMYSAGNPPTSVSNRRLDTALDFTENQRRNTEPTRQWAFTQLSAASWTTNPPAWCANYQFWAQIMAGAKGVLYFDYGANGAGTPYENLALTQGPVIEARDHIAPVITQIKDLCLYSVVENNITSNTPGVVTSGKGPGGIRGRSLMGENHQLAIVVNNNYTATSNTNYTLKHANEIAPHDVSLTVPIASWIALDATFKVFEVATSGLVPVSGYTVDAANRSVTFNAGDLFDRGRVFLFGGNDPVAPSAPTNFQRAQELSPTQSIITWAAALDNIGVRHYNIYVDNVLSGSSRHCMHTLNLQGVSTIGISAVDPFGNEGARLFQVVPEPGTIALLAAGVGTAVAAGCRRRRNGSGAP